jgi:hypothetical protein
MLHRHSFGLGGTMYIDELRQDVTDAVLLEELLSPFLIHFVSHEFTDRPTGLPKPGICKRRAATMRLTTAS